jgi:hypothetical protein
MKKILFISHALPPYLYPQSIQVGRFLNRLKNHFDLYIVCADEVHTPQDKTLYPDIFNGIDARNILKIPYIHKPILTYGLNRLCPPLTKRPDQYAAWAGSAYTACLDRFAHVAFDAIVTFSYPFSLNILGRKLKQVYQCPWIAHQSDPWADNPFLSFGPLTRPLNQFFEKKSFTASDKLIFTCAEAALFFQRKYPALRDRITFINHSFDPALYPAPEKKTGSRKIIRYIGSFYGDRTAKPLLKAIEGLSYGAKEHLKFEIIGANVKTRMLLQKSRLPQDLITATKRVSYAESLQMMADSDVLLVIDAPLPENNIYFPSKLADYLGANRPIIGISSPGPTRRILDSLGHACYGHDQIESLTQAFENIYLNYVHMPAFPPGWQNDYIDTENSRKLADMIDHV